MWRRRRRMWRRRRPCSPRFCLSRPLPAPRLLPSRRLCRCAFRLLRVHVGNAASAAQPSAQHALGGAAGAVFVGQREGGGAGEASPDLSAAFGGSSVEAAACFLRFLYRPREICPASFAALLAAGHLAGMAALAHKLNATDVLQCLESHLQGVVSSVPPTMESVPQLLTALQVAQACKFSTAQEGLCYVLADALAIAGGRWSEEILAALDSAALVQLLQLTGKRAVRGLYAVPSVFDVRPASSAVVAGGFTFAMSGFSRLDGHTGVMIKSRWVDINGCKWHLQVRPNGTGDHNNGHLSAYLYLDVEHARAAGVSAVTARLVITALDQRLGGGPPNDECLDTGSRIYDTTHSSWGFPKLVPLPKLKSPTNGYLVHDRLLLQVDIWITDVQRMAD